jgi:hypothetical protein
MDLDFGLGYEGKLGCGFFCFFLCLWNVINVPFFFFALGNAFQDLDGFFFSLGDPTWTWISA